jgi:preprotein translocase subunit YajC
MHIYAFIALQAPGGGGLSGFALLLPIMLIFVYMFYSQNRKQKKWQAMLGELKTGDKVVTSGGLRGTIVALKDDALHLRIPPDNLRVEVTRASIVSVIVPEEPVAK